MRVLVTGGSGFIGSHLVDKLAEAGHAVRILDISPPIHTGNVEFLKGDITSREDVRASLDGIEVVYHLAAFADINLVSDNPLKTIEYNIMGTAYLLEECRRLRVRRFILASSVYVYSKQGHLYTTAKLASEEFCKDYQSLYSLPYTILRYGTAYGPRSRMDDVVSIFTARALKGENLLVYGSGKQRRNFIYVEDLARGSVAALKETAENGTYTLCGKESITIERLARMVKRLFSSDIDIEYHPPRENDYGGEVFDLDKARRELGWEPEVSLEDGIKRFAEWYQRQSG
jgi:UDP-glucose 4-epimerase